MKSLTLCFAFSLVLVLAGCASAPKTSPEWDAEGMLREMVEVNSGTSNVAGVNAVQAKVAKRLEELGFHTEYFRPEPGNGPSGNLLVARLPGETAETITLLMHADTVFEPSSPFRGYARSADGKSAHGPGVIDDKGGIVVALKGLAQALGSGHRRRRTLQVVVSPAEETGSAAFAAKFAALSKSSWMVLSFEPGRIDGSIVKARKGNRWYSIRVVGHEAHSGKDHRDGVNACLELSLKLAAISKLTDYASEVTVSVGHMEGGQDKFNVVCGEATAKVDTRFMSVETRDRLHERIVAILARPEVRAANGGRPTEISFTIADDSPPLSSTAASRPYLDAYLSAIAAEEGKRPEALSTGGTGDANAFGGGSAIILDGLGPLGDHMHTPEEYILLPTIDTRARAFASFLAGVL